MDILFRPVMGLLDRFRYPWKFAIIATVCALGSVVLLWQVYVGLRDDITLSERELAGLVVLDKAYAVLVLSQQHRGLSAGLLGGSEDLRPAVAEKAGALDKALTVVDAELEGTPEWHALQDRWRTIREQLQVLTREGLKMPAAENFRAHSLAIESVLAWIGDIGDAANLSLDPESASYNLIEPMLRSVPDLTERLGRLRGRATGIIARGSLQAVDERSIVAQLAELSMTETQFRDRLARAIRDNTSLKGALGAALSEIDAGIGRFRTAVQVEVLEQGFRMAPSEFFGVGSGAIEIVLKHYRESLRPEAERLLHERLDTLLSRLYAEAAIAGVALLMAGYLFGGIYFSILRSVRELTAGARQLAQGDYRTRVTFTARDELLDVADAFNAMVKDVGELIAEIQRGGERLVRVSVEMSNAASRGAEGASAQSEAATGMAAAVEEMTVGIDEIARHAGTAQALAEKSGALSGEGGDVMQRTVSEMERIADAVHSSAATISELGEKARQIGSMVVVIKQIADQTNLLALNAAIEAARAGESGRGFAVVADEVRKLAERTASATEEITDMAGSIGHGTEQAVSSMQAGVARVRDGVELTARAGQAMAEINSGADEVLRAVSEISRALREQSSASAEIARNVERIARMAEENSSAVNNTAQISSGLGALAQELEQRVERFHV
ncbi:methyl-accepting chemotaxis protein [Azoarcus sp. L1K30]|uniref:methyl-accepting chemotaxis protein n=1 Tax=Azoarcus sp. L1K30 TaxID=2820277 RepID=UPI001B845CBF|nr:methyl-accepting chemotaxis protein [Azoarcus sp. L1K30]MBR0566274.1 methyl-accepting chemotaxis protein [Azoarcus sp. L1K30]